MQVPPTQRPDADIEMTQELLISAYMDGNGNGQPDVLLSPEGLQTWEMYHLIGDSLRSSELSFSGGSMLSRKISIALESEPALKPASVQPHLSPIHQRSDAQDLAPSRLQAPTAIQTPVISSDTPATSSAGLKRPGKRLGMIWPSLAMAAAVVSVVWVARPFFVPDQMMPPLQQVAVADPVKPVDPAAVNDYLQAHRQLSGPAAVRPASFTPGSSR